MNTVIFSLKSKDIDCFKNSLTTLVIKDSDGLADYVEALAEKRISLPQVINFQSSINFSKQENDSIKTHSAASIIRTVLTVLYKEFKHKPDTIVIYDNDEYVRSDGKSKKTYIAKYINTNTFKHNPELEVDIRTTRVPLFAETFNII